MQFNKLALRQVAALNAIPTQIGLMSKAFIVGNIGKALSIVVIIAQLLGVIIVDSPAPLLGDTIDMSQYELTCRQIPYWCRPI